MMKFTAHPSTACGACCTACWNFSKPMCLYRRRREGREQSPQHWAHGNLQSWRRWKVARGEYSTVFQQHQRVTIIPDNDEPGRKRARGSHIPSWQGSVAEILALPNLPLKGNVSDW